MFSETYRSMNRTVSPSSALIAETLARTQRHSRPVLRRAALIAAVLAVCLATPALAARTEKVILSPCGMGAPSMVCVVQRKVAVCVAAS